jgi:hypothetical protein
MSQPYVGVTGLIGWDYADCVVHHNRSPDQFTLSEPYLYVPTSEGEGTVSTVFVREFYQQADSPNPTDYCMFYSASGETDPTSVRWIWREGSDNRFTSDVWFDGVDDGNPDFNFTKLWFKAPEQFPVGVDHTKISHPPATSRYGLLLQVARKLPGSNNVAHYFDFDPNNWNWETWFIETPLFDISLTQYGGEHPLRGPVASNKVFGGFVAQ